MQKPELISLRSHNDTVALVPSLLGFQPSESIVILALDGGQLAVTARIDFTEAAALPRVLLQLDERIPGCSIVVLFYTAQYPTLAFKLANMAAELPGVKQTFVVVGVRWSTGDDQEHGTVDQTAAVVCQAAVAGLYPAASREALLEMIRPVEDPTPVGLDLRSELVAIEAADLDHWCYVARTSGSLDAIGLAGVAAYRDGNGALANLCLERLPADHLARKILTTAVQQIVLPDRLADLIAVALLTEECQTHDE